MNDLLPFAAALAIGLLIGAERERRKGTTRERGAAGIRTFALTAMLGTVTMSAGGVWFVVAMAVSLSTLLAVAYLRPHDDPDIAQRMLGPRAGLPVTGFVSGFASSIATISAMGALAKRNPERLPTAAAGAVLSTIATMIQLGIVIGTIHPGVLIQLAFPLGAGALSALAYALWALWRASRQNGADTPVIDTGIDLKSALILTLSVSLVMLASGALSQWYGRAGLLVVAMTGGLADAHSVAASVTSLVEQGQLSMPSAALPILAGVSTNALAKGVVAAISGGPRFAKTVVPGLVFVVAAIWLADILSSTGGAGQM
ncbi:putative transmembrane protein [Pandoraea sputorum]|uniref:Putative transmembrane protein n=2 Tax=Pandoraea sputorum TaxID=93222 RepID=A0A5E5AX92_9BURK|nr:putative transmembrane protein [Pandoraea sputorum]